MIHFVGAGSGAPDLITVRGQKFLREADVVIYAGSLVNPELLKETKPGCEILNSAYMTLDEVIRAMEKAEREGKMTVRLHTGDPAIYGALVAIEPETGYMRKRLLTMYARGSAPSAALHRVSMRNSRCLACPSP